MKTEDYLQDYAKKADQYLDKFFSQKEKEAAKISVLTGQMMKIYREYMKGGKKARGALTYLGYHCSGGKNEKVALLSSIAVETLHHFLLIHDDWIDRDLFRHGRPTVHLQYEKIFKQKKWLGDGSHWATGMAIILGDAGHALVYEILSQLPCPAGLRCKAISRLVKYSLNTVYGEALDISCDYPKQISFKEILKIRKYKTAYYTMVMPLAIGATLAGADDQKIKAIENYGLPVGIAFQLRDDELGLFGNEKILGKSTVSDLIEGKKTLLYCQALERLSEIEKKQLINLWGKAKVSKSNIDQVKNLIEKSGVLEYSRKTSRLLVKKGKKYVPKITKVQKYRNLLCGLADFMIEREK